MAKPKAALKRAEEITLNQVEQFYIKNNPDMSVEELSSKLNKPLDVIVEYCAAALKSEKRKKARQLMDRPAKGAIAMNRAASMDGDEVYSSYTTLEAIKKATEDGDLESVKKLKTKYDKEQREEKQVRKNLYEGIIHYIEPPQED